MFDFETELINWRSKKNHQSTNQRLIKLAGNTYGFKKLFSISKNRTGRIYGHAEIRAATCDKPVHLESPYIFCTPNLPEQHTRSISSNGVGYEEGHIIIEPYKPSGILCEDLKKSKNSIRTYNPSHRFAEKQIEDRFGQSHLFSYDSDKNKKATQCKKLIKDQKRRVILNNIPPISKSDYYSLKCFSNTHGNDVPNVRDLQEFCPARKLTYMFSRIKRATLNGTKVFLNGIQKKQTKEHFDGPPQEHVYPQNYSNFRLPMPYEFYGGCAPNLVITKENYLGFPHKLPNDSSPLPSSPSSSKPNDADDDVSNQPHSSGSKQPQHLISEQRHGSGIPKNDTTTELNKSRSSTQSITTEVQVNPIVFSGFGFTIRLNDLKTLDPDQELEDNIIDAFTAILTDPHRNCGTHALSTHFIEFRRTNIDEHGEWSGEYFVFPELEHLPSDVTQIFYPMHVRDHWVLFRMLMSPDRNCIEIYDSNPEHSFSSSTLSEMLTELQVKLIEMYPTRNWETTYKHDIPRQQNLTDCGVFVLYYMESLLSNQRMSLFSTPDINKYREKMKIILTTHPSYSLLSSAPRKEKARYEASKIPDEISESATTEFVKPKLPCTEKPRIKEKAAIKCKVCTQTHSGTQHMVHVNTTTKATKSDYLESPADLVKGFNSWSRFEWGNVESDFVCRNCYYQLVRIRNAHQTLFDDMAMLESQKSITHGGIFGIINVRYQEEGRCYHCVVETAVLTSLLCHPKRSQINYLTMAKCLSRDVTGQQKQVQQPAKIHLCKTCCGKVVSVWNCNQRIDNFKKIMNLNFRTCKQAREAAFSAFSKKSYLSENPSIINPAEKRSKPSTSNSPRTRQVCRTCGTSINPTENEFTFTEEYHGQPSIADIKQNMNPTIVLKWKNNSNHVCETCFRKLQTMNACFKSMQTSENHLKHAGRKAGGGLFTDSSVQVLPHNNCINCHSETLAVNFSSPMSSGKVIGDLLTELVVIRGCMNSIAKNDWTECHLCVSCVYYLCTTHQELTKAGLVYNSLAGALDLRADIFTKEVELRNSSEVGEATDSVDFLSAFENLMKTTKQQSQEDKLQEKSNPEEQGIKVFERELAKEFDGFCQAGVLRCNEVPSLKQINAFSLDEIRDYVYQNCPKLTVVLQCLIGVKIDKAEKLTSAALFVISSLAFQRNRNLNVMQRLLGFLLWRNGLSTRTFQLMNALGISTSVDATRRLADKLLIGNDEKVQAIKTEVETAIKPLYDIPIDSNQPPNEVNVNTYTFAYDNVNYNVTPRHQGPFVGQTMLNWTIKVLVRNRVPSTIKRDEVLSKAAEIPITEYILNDEEKAKIREERGTILKEIACRNLQCFQTNRFYRFIESREVAYPNESKERTSYVPLGLSKENEGTTVGNINLLDELRPLIPSVDGHCIPILTIGDGATMNSILHAKRARAMSLNEEDSLRMFYCIHGGWHEQGILFGDFHNRYGNQISRTSPGSMEQIKILMNMKGATSEKTFTQTQDLINQIMEGFGVLAYMHVMGITTFDEIPSEFPDPTDVIASKAYFEQQTNSVLQLLNFEQVHLQQGRNVCSRCNSIGDEEVLICCNESCRLGRKFHSDCSLLPSNENDDSIFCSEECLEEDKTNLYSRAMLVDALTLHARRKANRINDGEMIFIHTKEDFMYFLKTNHYKYSAFLHNYIVSQNGCVPSHIAADILNNRNVNTRGQSDSNIETDLFVEHHVKDAKDHMASVPGDLGTSLGLDRRTKLTSVADDIKLKMFEEVGTSTKQQTQKVHNITRETKMMVEALEPEKLFEVHRNRSHNGYRNFRYVKIYDVDEVTKRVNTLSEEYDLYNDIANHFQTDPTTTERCRTGLFYAVLPNLSGTPIWSISNRLVVRNPLWIKLHQEHKRLLIPNDLQFSIASKLLTEDVVCVLPTSIGKSYVFTLSGLIHHSIRKDKTLGSMVLCVMPLEALVRSQIAGLTTMGLRSYTLDPTNMDHLLTFIDTAPQVLFVFISPENLNTEIVRNGLRGLPVTLIVVDEAHLINSWGESFRPDFRAIGEIRALTKARVGAFTATCTEKDLECIKDCLSLSKTVTVVNAQPDRPNIYLAQRSSYVMKTFYTELINDLKKYGNYVRKTIIYVDTYSDMNKVHAKLMKELRGDGYIGREANGLQNALVVTYAKGHTLATKTYIENTFSLIASHIRVIVSTISFGMGVDIPDIGCVVRLSSTDKIAQHWQEIGRAGRRGQPSLSLCFGPRPTSCLRKRYLDAFELKNHENSTNYNLEQLCTHKRVACDNVCQRCECHLCTCCDFCYLQCSCAGKFDAIHVLFPNWKLTIAKNPTSVKPAQVSDSQFL